eukprot:10764200-Prorocentrum_lima.AAC.1
MSRGVFPTLHVPTEAEAVIGAEKEVLNLWKEHLGYQSPPDKFLERISVRLSLFLRHKEAVPVYVGG